MGAKRAVLCAGWENRSPSTLTSFVPNSGPWSGGGVTIWPWEPHADGSDPFSQGTLALDWGTPFTPEQTTFSSLGPQYALCHPPSHPRANSAYNSRAPTQGSSL